MRRCSRYSKGGDTRLFAQKEYGSATVVFSTNYESFDVAYASSGTDPSVKYTGQWSEAVGLYWNHARFYDPTLGRFVSADPVLGHLSAPQTLDRYAYAVNNPMRFSDPSGRDCSWNPLSWGDCLASAGSAVGSFLYENTIGAAISSYNWYVHASASDQGAFWLGVLAAVAVGVVVGASCVVALCAGLPLLAVIGIGIGTGVAGSIVAGAVYQGAGGRSRGGLQATMFRGGIGASVGFAVGGAVGGAFGAEAGAGVEGATAGESDLPESVAQFFERQDAMMRSWEFHNVPYSDASGDLLGNFLEWSTEQALEPPTGFPAYTEGLKWLAELGAGMGIHALVEDLERYSEPGPAGFPSASSTPAAAGASRLTRVGDSTVDAESAAWHSPTNASACLCLCRNEEGGGP